MTIFEPMGRVRLHPRPKKYGVNVFGIKADGTIREWVEEIVGGSLLLLGFGVMYYIVAAAS
jgi:hypothetical protein